MDPSMVPKASRGQYAIIFFMFLRCLFLIWIFNELDLDQFQSCNFLFHGSTLKIFVFLGKLTINSTPYSLPLTHSPNSCHTHHTAPFLHTHLTHAPNLPSHQHLTTIILSNLSQPAQPTQSSLSPMPYSLIQLISYINFHQPLPICITINLAHHHAH